MPNEKRPKTRIQSAASRSAAAPRSTRSSTTPPGPSPARPSPGGNLATLRALGIRARLSVSQPSDPQEQEADRAADAFAARAPQPRATGEERAAAGKPEGSGGAPLAPQIRCEYEGFFDADLSGVRIHTEQQAHAAARSISATAFTHGSDVYFQSGRFDPATGGGQKLLAHELAHVVQGDAAGARLHRQVDPNFVVDEPYAGGLATGAAERIFFARGSDAIPAQQAARLGQFKWGPDRAATLMLNGMATEDEIAADPLLPERRAAAVSTALGEPLSMFMPLRHEGARIIIPGNHASTRDPDLRFNRAVEIVVAGAAPAAPATAGALTCSPAAVAAARTTALGWIADTRREVRDRPVASSSAGADQELFFGTHEASTARRIDHNLGIIGTELDRLTQPGKYKCDATDPKCIGGTIAFNRLGTMYICPSFDSHSAEEQASVLIHEAAHSAPSLRITGLDNKDGTVDFAYRFERLIHTLGALDPNLPLYNSDSYAMFVVSRRAPAALAGQGQSPPPDPAPSGFTGAADAGHAQLALGLAQQWIRITNQWLVGLHVALQGQEGTAIPGLTLIAPLRTTLAAVQASFPPILSQPNLRRDDLIMIAGVLDRYREVRRLLQRPVAIVSGGTTAFSASGASLTLTVDATFLGMSDDIARTRIVLDKLIEFLGPAQVGAALRPGYGDFAQTVRRMVQ